MFLGWKNNVSATDVKTYQTERHVLKMNELYLGCLPGTHYMEKDDHTQVLSGVPFFRLFIQCTPMLSIYNIYGNLHHVIRSDILWISCFNLFLTSQDGNILHKDNLTVKDISRHTFRTTLKDKKFASYWKERSTLNSCLQLVNARLRARRIRSCVKTSHIKSIDQEDQQSKHKLPYKFSPKKKMKRREKTSKTASNHMYNRVYINANSQLI